MASAESPMTSAASMATAEATAPRRERRRRTERRHRNNQSNRSKHGPNRFQKSAFHKPPPNYASLKGKRMASSKQLKTLDSSEGARVEKHHNGEKEPPPEYR